MEIKKLTFYGHIDGKAYFKDADGKLYDEDAVVVEVTDRLLEKIQKNEIPVEITRLGEK